MMSYNAEIETALGELCEYVTETETNFFYIDNILTIISPKLMAGQHKMIRIVKSLTAQGLLTLNSDMSFSISKSGFERYDMIKKVREAEMLKGLLKEKTSDDFADY